MTGTAIPTHGEGRLPYAGAEPPIIGSELFADIYIGADGRIRTPVRTKAQRIARVRRIKAHIAAYPSIGYPKEREL